VFIIFYLNLEVYYFLSVTQFQKESNLYNTDTCISIQFKTNIVAGQQKQCTQCEFYLRKKCMKAIKCTNRVLMTDWSNVWNIYFFIFKCIIL